ncbi:LemA family protein [Patescibacteria group bacterium]|nr:LemA family protein [Patescibacteria group bacterium]
MKKFLVLLGIVVLVVGVSVVGLYNRLVTKNQEVDGQWAQVEVQYQRRFDLIPNLVNSVEGLMKQEQAVFGQIAEARTKYGGATTVDEKAEAASQVESALGRLLVIMENYPELKSNETVIQLMDELSGTENRVSIERRRFNDVVREFNTMLVRFPENLIAKLLGFEIRAYFESVEAAAEAPAVEINL